MKRMVWIGLALLMAIWSVNGEELQSIRNFGDHLFMKGDYYRAITEYERFLFLDDGPSAHSEEVQYSIASAYFWGEKWDAAQQRFLQLRNNSRASLIGKMSTLYLASIAENQKRPLLAADYLEGYLDAYPHDAWSVAAGDQLVLNYMKLGDSSNAKRIQEKTDALPLTITAEDIDRYFALPRKSPLKAGVLSAVLPGAGQVYNGHYSDAFWAFALNAIFIGGSYAAFDNDEDVLGVFLVFMETTWYSGNIYNAVNGARQFNRQQQERFMRNLKIQYGLSFPPGSENGPMPVLGIRSNF